MNVVHPVNEFQHFSISNSAWVILKKTHDPVKYTANSLQTFDELIAFHVVCQALNIVYKDAYTSSFTARLL